MQDICLLETVGYSVSLEFLEWRPTIRDVLIRTTLTLNPQLGKVTVACDPTWILTNDVGRLVAYLEQHIQALRKDSNHISHAYVDSELHFLVQAFEGEIRAENSGEFSLQFMLNIGRSDHDAANTYLGCNSVVAVQNVTAFIGTSRAMLAQYSENFGQG